MRWGRALCAGLLAGTLLASPAIVKAEDHSPQPADRPVLEALAEELDISPDALARVLKFMVSRFDGERNLRIPAQAPSTIRRDMARGVVRERVLQARPWIGRLSLPPGTAMRRWQALSDAWADRRLSPERQEIDPRRNVHRTIRPFAGQGRAIQERYGASADQSGPILRIARLLHAALSQIEWRTEDGTVVKPHLVWEAVTPDNE